jgi:hypothetical protein
MIGKVLKGAIAVPFYIVFAFAAPFTFILLIISTWQSQAPLIVKLFLMLTVDAFLAAAGPFTWAIWAIELWLGRPTPVSVLFG